MDKQKKRNLRSMLISVGVIIIALLLVWFGGNMVINQLEHTGMVTPMDVQSTIQLTSKYFIPLAVILVLIILAIIVFWNKSRKFNFWLKWESFVTFLVALVLTLNVVVFEPMQALMNVNFAKVNQVSAKTVNEGKEVTDQIGNEGTVLLKNQNNYLPIKAQNINVFGWASSNPLYGGTGSGAGNTINATDIYQSLNDAGFKTNNQLLNFYKKYRKDRSVVSMMAQDWTLPEPKVSQYSSQMMNHAKSFSDTAMVVIARSGGEGSDLPTNMGKLPGPAGMSKGATYKGNKGDFKNGDTYLQLSKTERNMLSMVNKNFKNVIVLINSSNPMELGFLNHYSHIKSALLMSAPGMTGFSALGKILKGQVNPSGRTADTFVYDLKKTPTFNNFGDFKYANEKGMISYANYVENIYVGYKYWETKYLNNNSGYNKAVQFPFGYGLSYTNFSQRMSNLKTNFKTGKMSFDVTVKNTGKRAGKDVVQAYYSAPYKNGGIEKAATNLLDFQKTKNLKPGESQTVHFSFNQADLASWDSKNGGAYVLDQGRYQIQIKNNSHDVLGTRSFNLNKEVVYNSDNKRPTDKVAAKDEFQDAQGKVTYLSRKNNFANYNEATKAPGQENLPASVLKTATVAQNPNYGKAPKATGKMPALKQRNNIELSDLRGKSYDDPMWNKLLDEMSVKDLGKVITYGGYQTFRIPRVKKLETYDFDGPSGLSSTFVKMNTTLFPGAEMIACTWNKDIAHHRGKVVGEQGKQSGVYGWYGPAMNIHRSAFGGRDFEYYSEDPILSGNMAANEIAGARSQGVYSYMKHFAMNNQETNRNNSLMEWNTEQSIRETYLKSFEMAAKQGGARAAMTAFSFIGNKWCGANSHLLQNVMRGEWGFRGFAETDYFMGHNLSGMNADTAIANGNDLMLSTTGVGANVQYTNNPTQVRYMKQAAHNIMYTVVNSGAYAKKNYSHGQSTLLPYQKSFITYFVIAYIVIGLIQVLAIFLYRRKYVKKN